MYPHMVFGATLVLLLPTVCTAAASEMVTIWSWPLSAASPQPLADITYDIDSLSYSVARYSPPKSEYSTEDLVRVGLYDIRTAAWRGSVTSAASFDPRHQHKVHLHVDTFGNVYHVDFAAFATAHDPREEKRKAKKEARAAEKAKKNAAKARAKPKSKGAEPQEHPQPIVEILRQSEGPSPHLNKPVVLNEEGKVDEQEPEKTFLQKCAAPLRCLLTS